MPILLQIAVGGAIGASARYLSVLLVTRLAGSSFPWGTMAVNVIGSFAMGIVVVLAVLRGDPELRRLAPFLMTGMLGGFTTFSAFSLEALELIQDDRFAAALGYIGGSVALAIGGLAAGMWLARGWVSP